MSVDVDHDVDPDRGLLRLDELRERSLSVVFVAIRCTVGFGKPDAATSFARRPGRTACRAPCRLYQAVLAGGIARAARHVEAAEDHLVQRVRSIASSKACRSFGSSASGVPTFWYGGLPAPLRLPI